MEQRIMNNPSKWGPKVRKMVMISLAIFTAWTYFWYPEYLQKQRMQDRVNQLKVEISELQSEIEYNTERIALLKFDPVTIESEMRRNLRWVRPGELPVEINN